MLWMRSQPTKLLLLLMFLIRIVSVTTKAINISIVVRMAGIPEDDEMLPSCVEDVRASIDLDGEPKRSYLYAALDLQKLWVLVKNSGPMATCALSARRSYNFRTVFGFPSISFTKHH